MSGCVLESVFFLSLSLCAAELFYDKWLLMQSFEQLLNFYNSSKILWFDTLIGINKWKLPVSKLISERSILSSCIP